jgi:xanthine/CO dehydrogenase XdhC/CoxF family maturation factor
MKEIVDQVERWRKRGERIAMATVVATRKSAPR